MTDKTPGSKNKGAKAKRIALIVVASLVGVSVASVLATIGIYDSLFERYERPDYDLYPGLYCYERVRERLPREEFWIPSGEHRLRAYYYAKENQKGLVVLAHGFHAGADDYLPLILRLWENGFAILSYDVTGVYASEGDGVVGMCQSLVDLDRVFDYTEKNAPFDKMEKVVVGHSWGGYASASVLALHPEIRSAVLLAPMNSGPMMAIETAEQYAGKIAYTGKPILEAYQKVLFGEYMQYNGVGGINATNAPVLIAQGVDDTIIAPDRQSITAHLDEIENPNVTLYWGKGLNGSHTGIWHSVASEEYQREVENTIKKREWELGRELTKEEKKEFYRGVDHELYSAVNEELLAEMIATFERGLSKKPIP